MQRPNRLCGECLSEFLGTLILVFFGVGAVNTAVLAGAQQGLWQVAVVWGVAIALAIYAVGAVSGAHINPAITIAMTVWRGFPKGKVAPYILSQLAGAFCGSLILYGLFHGMIAHFEAVNGLVRGGPGSELSAMVFGEYFPNPAMIGTTPEAYRQVSHITAMFGEVIGTAFLACFVLALTEPRNPESPRFMTPIFIGLSVSIIISIVAPLTQAGLNPARDFGPRLVSYIFGWGDVAIPGPRGGFLTVYILSPIIGAVFGAGVYQGLVRRYLPRDRVLGVEASQMAVEEGTA
ncbi:MAG: aquaporin [Armatimonadota bacterium]|nr:aquaporin [Armatimonadota bacterium]